MDNREIVAFAELSDEAKATLQRAVSTLHLSARSYMKIIKVSRTIADMEKSTKIQSSHVAEALQYRPASIAKS